ncbi:MAG: hypothetical protein ACYTG1_02750 [Planctomycetota bacterium]|jgi:hypothetical protein
MSDDRHDDIRLIRRYCDGELSPDEAAAVERRIAADPRVRDAVAAERALRERVRAIAEAEAPAAPGEVRRRVLASLAAERADAGATVIARVGGAAPRRANVFAVVATLALVAGAVLYGIFGPRIDDHRADPATNLVVEDAIWASEEHTACADDGLHRDRKLRRRGVEDVEDDLREWLGVPSVRVFDLSAAGYRLLGAGHCKVPGPVPSGHLMYARGGAEPALVSLFVVPDRGQFEGAPPPSGGDPWFAIDGGPRCRKSVLNTTEGDLVYFLVCCDERDLTAVAGEIARQLDVR